MPAKRKAAIVCCSNGISLSRKDFVEALCDTLYKQDCTPVLSDFLYAKDGVFSGNGMQRARALMDFYKNPDIDAILDISGGDIANEILPYLDFDVIARSKKTFVGYSDLTVILNAIYAKTGLASILYPVKNLLTARGDDIFFPQNLHWIQGSHMQGVVLGGNIRCLLKLAGTEYFPDMTDAVLLLEARSGTPAQMTTYFSQLKMLGVFEKINGILLGTFTEMEQLSCTPTVPELLKNYVSNALPIAQTRWIGHGKDARGIWIGRELAL